MNKFLAALIFLGMPGLLSAVGDATVKATQGPVSVRSAGTKKWVPATVGQKIKRNDQIKTGNAALIQVEFDSGATLLVKEKSFFALRRDKRGRIVAFKFGEFLIGLKKGMGGGQNKFRVRTPAAVASVRGTVFWGKSDESETSTYACFKGSIEIRGQGKSVLLEPGNTTTIAKGQAPAEPTAHSIPADYVNTFKINDSLAGIDQLLNE